MLRFLKHFLAKIRCLQWKLTFSYILLTSVALVVTIAMAILILAQFAVNQYLKHFSDSLQDARYSASDDLNHARLTAGDLNEFSSNWWVDAYYDIHDGAMSIDISVSEVKGYSIVVDPRGRVLVSSDPNVMPLGSLLSSKLSPGGMSIVLLAGTSNANDKPIVLLDQQHMLYGAVPLFNPHRERLGILLIVQTFPSRGQLIVTLFSMFWPMIALITCVVSIVGALFGSVMSHWFVQRFMKVTKATSSWSQGDFSLIITDHSEDEFGVMTRQLNHMAGKLEHLMHERQNMAMLEERNRVARDLHDSLKQQIFASIMQVWSVQVLLDTNISAAREQLGSIERLLEQSQQELSMLIHQLRPVTLAGRRFSEALHDYCMQWARERSIVLDLDVAEVGLSISAEEAFFRITQEALANVARHSHASTVQVQLIDQQEQVLLSITDNGRGFDLEQVRDGGGVGLHSMRERMEMLQGTLSIVSQHGHGTSIGAMYTKGKSSKQQGSSMVLL